MTTTTQWTKKRFLWFLFLSKVALRFFEVMYMSSRVLFVRSAVMYFWLVANTFFYDARRSEGLTFCRKDFLKPRTSSPRLCYATPRDRLLFGKPSNVIQTARPYLYWAGRRNAASKATHTLETEEFQLSTCWHDFPLHTAWMFLQRLLGISSFSHIQRTLLY